MSEWRTTVDGVTTTRCCAWSPPGCHPVGCGLKVHVQDGKVIKVEGDPEHPITKGALCVRCLTLKDYIYHPDRITKPIKRAREDRGLDKWVETTWDDALDIIEKNAKEIQAKYGPEAIVVFGGTGREGDSHYNMFANSVFDSPNSCYAQGGWSCYGPRSANTAFLMGGGFPEIDYAQKFYDRYDHEGYHIPDVILIWGKEPLKSNPDGTWGHAVLELKRLGSKIICVDPRVTWLGTRSEMVLQVRPGTDVALAMAMLNVIFTEELYDADWCDKWTYGLAEFADRCKTMAVEEAADICGLTPEEIYAAARLFGNAEHSAVMWGLATDQTPNGSQLAQCLLALMTIQGCLDAPGGTLLGGTSPKPVFGKAGRVQVTDGDVQGGSYDSGEKLLGDMCLGVNGFDVAFKQGFLTDERWAKRIGVDKYPSVGAVMWTVHPDEFLKTLETGLPYKIHMAMAHCSNPCGTAISNEPQRWTAALKTLDFNFAVETFHNATTMAVCDVVLPLASTIEHNFIVSTFYGQNLSFFGAEARCVQVGECKSDVEILIEVGKRMHPEFWGQFKCEEDYIEFNGNLGLVKWRDVQENVTLMAEENYRKYETGELRSDGKPGFPTKTGRVELYSNAFAMYGDDPLPYFKEPPFSPRATPGKTQQFPFVLTTGARKYTSFHSEHRQLAQLREIDPLPDVEISPEDAEMLGIKTGDWVKITTPFGHIKQYAKVVPTIKKGVVHSSHGWWFPEQDPNEPNLFGNWKSNINVATPNGYVGVQGWGNLNKCLVCSLEKTTNDVTDIVDSSDIVRLAKENKLA